MVLKLHIHNGCFAYGDKQVFNQVNIELKKNEILAIMGPNGAGKTTFIKCIMNMLKWTQGSCYLDGRDMTDIPIKDLWKQISYVPQSNSNRLLCTIKEMILLGRSPHIGLLSEPKKKDVQKTEEMMELLGIHHLADSMCKHVSGGEYQMALLARALVSEPELLILDEPEANLDFKNRLLVLETIKRISSKVTCIMNTHYPEHAMQLANQTLLFMGANHHLVGDSAEIITEDNLRKSLQVDVIIGCNERLGESRPYIIPVQSV